MHRFRFKAFFFCSLLTLSFSSGFAAPKLKSILNNGFWRSGATWDANRVPATSDTVIIQANQIIIVDNPNTLGDVYVQVFGTLRFLHGKLSLGARSVVVVYPSGRIEGNSNSEKIGIGANEVFNGADPDIIGPSIANSSTGTAFSPFTLPVTFLEFTLTATSTAILLQWATTEELQADRFEIETSLDGRTWSRLASVQAKGSFSGITKYAYTANRTSASLTYFRIKEVDTDGRFMYSSVRVCKQHGEASPALSIGSTHGKVVLRFSEEANEKVLVRIFNLNGQAISHHYLYNASGIVTLDLPGKVKGNFVISVENSTGRTAKQVFL